MPPAIRHIDLFTRLIFWTLFVVATCTTPASGQSISAQESAYTENLKTIRMLLELPEDRIDTARANLIIDKMIEPKIDVEDTLKTLDKMVAAIKAKLPPNASSLDKVKTLREFLYIKGSWNRNKPYQYDFSDPLGTNVHNKLLPNYIASKKGNCVSMPLLFIALGQRLGIEVTAALVPSHVFVKYHDDTGNWLNLETTGTANPTADASYRKQVSMTDQSIANGLYMRPLSKKETLTVMLGTLIQHYTSQGNNTHVIGVADLVLAHYPNSINALLSRGTAFIRMRDELLSEIEGLPDVPGTQAILSAEKMSISEYERINARAFDQAEALGWREPTPEENIAYLQRIQQQIPLQTTQSKE